MSLHAVVRWKDNDSSAVFGLIPVSCFVQIRGELKAGQTVHALFNGKIRRAEILLLSGDYQYLEVRLAKMEKQNNVPSHSNSQNIERSLSLESTISKLKKALNLSEKDGAELNYTYNNHNLQDNFLNGQRPTTSRNSLHNSSGTNLRERNSMDILQNVCLAKLSKTLPSNFSVDVNWIKEKIMVAQFKYYKLLSTMKKLRKGINAVHTNFENMKIINEPHLSKESSVTRTIKKEKKYINKKATKMIKSEKKAKTSENFADSVDENDMVPIGTGSTKVPLYIMNQINWDSHTMATRKLLISLFPRKTLATHSLTGKASPAFANKPAKLCLDPQKVNDIVITVSEKCSVTPTVVRSAITTKCADENKMYRTREARKLEMLKKKGNINHQDNQENIPPEKKKDKGTPKKKSFVKTKKQLFDDSF